MTLANLVSTGSGRLAARWEIEGLAIEFCTEPGMEQTLSDGRRRLCVTSLQECGFSIEESVNIPEALLEAQATSLTLWETLDEDLAGIFHHRPDVERFGATGISDSDTSINLYSTTGISTDDVLHIGTEAVVVTDVPDATNITVDRAHWGTVAQYHYAADTPGHPDMMVTNRPLRVRGRQVRLWLYGDGDDLQGNGSQRWIGIVNAEPMLAGSGTSYRLSFGPITDRLKTKIGGDLDTPVRPRGVYYPATAALRIQIMENGSSNPFDLFTGFYETQGAFVDALNDWLNTGGESAIADASLDSAYTAEVTDDGLWTIGCTVGASTTSTAIVIESEQDGLTTARLGDMRLEHPTDGTILGDGYSISSGEKLYPVFIDGAVPGQRTVPRGFWGHSPRTVLHLGSAATTAPWKRVYVDRDVDSGSWSSVMATWYGVAGDKLHTVDVANESDNYLDLNHAPRSSTEGTTAPGYPYTAATPTAFALLRTITTGNLADFRNALITEAIEYANLGTTPFITSRDLATWTGPVGRSAVLPWQAVRFYAFAASADFEEVLSAECRMLALYPITNTQGKIALAEFDLPTASTTAAYNIDEEISIIDGRAVDLSSMARGNQTVNRVKLHTGFDPREDKWSSFVEVQDKTSFALDHQDRPLEIEPRSFATGPAGGDAAITGEDLATAVLPVLSIFGYPHEFVDVKVPWTAFDLRLGDAVTFSADHLPSYITGERPISAVNATVVGRKWKLGEAYGELTVLLSWQNVAGYAPSALVSSQNNTSGDTWDLTIDTSWYFASGDDPTDHYAAGDKVRIYDVDTETATTVTGTVDSVTSTVIEVTFDATWTPGSDTWVLGFDTYTNVVEDQKIYAFFAGPDLVLGASDAPRTLGP